MKTILLVLAVALCVVSAADKRIGEYVVMSNRKDLAKIEALQKKNMELEVQAAKLRKQLEAQAEEQRQVSRSRSTQQTREVQALAQSNAVLRAITAERKATK